MKCYDHPSPYFNNEKMAHFGFSAISSLIRGGRSGFISYFNLTKIVRGPYFHYKRLSTWASQITFQRLNWAVFARLITKGKER